MNLLKKIFKSGFRKNKSFVLCLAFVLLNIAASVSLASAKNKIYTGPNSIEIDAYIENDELVYSIRFTEYQCIG